MDQNIGEGLAFGSFCVFDQQKARHGLVQALLPQQGSYILRHVFIGISCKVKAGRQDSTGIWS
jgi:hypothetical protein